jgi:copper chaperone CopZ
MNSAMKRKSLGPRRLVPCSAIALALGLFCSASLAADDKPTQPQTVTYRITGLCCTEREDDLRETVKRMSDVKLVSVDFKNAEATFEYDSANLFPNASAKDVTERFGNLLRKASFNTFAINPAPRVPADKLKRVEILVKGLDCKGCCLGAYEAIYKISGVEYATASFKEGRVTALIDPEKTNRNALEVALKQKGVTLKSP